MDTIQIFHAALEQARTLQRERDEAIEKHSSMKDAVMKASGEMNQLQAELEVARAALSLATTQLHEKSAMVQELSSQLDTLGTLFITCAGEVTKVLNKLSKSATADKEFVGTPAAEVELVGPFVGTQEEAKTNIPFAPGVKQKPLLSATATQMPAFLLRTGTRGAGAGHPQLSPDIFEQMTWKERKNYHRAGVIPERLRR